MALFNDLDARLLVDLLRDRIKPQRSLGQHFLVDEKIILRSIEIASEFKKPLSSQSHILEIGPGPGSLTLELLRSNARLTALEIDNESVSHLKRVFPNLEYRFVLNEQDALIGNWPSDITHLISNLPYQISSPVLEKIQNEYVDEIDQAGVFHLDQRPHHDILQLKRRENGRRSRIAWNSKRERRQHGATDIGVVGNLSANDCLVSACTPFPAFLFRGSAPADIICKERRHVSARTRDRTDNRADDA